MSGITPADCPQPGTHGHLGRDCPYCSWTESIDAGRHASTVHLLSLFEYGHLPVGPLHRTSSLLAGLAYQLVTDLADGPELTTGLRKLLEAKDCFVRQAVVDNRTGTPTPS